MFLPFTFTVKELSATFFQAAAFMEQDRVELSTPALSERCSNQLSYWPKLVENRGFEPLTLGLQSRCSSQLS